MTETNSGREGRKEPGLFQTKPILWHGDWFDVFNRMEPQSIDLILTDPPYGILEKCQDTDKAVDLTKLQITFDKVLKPMGLVILFCNLDLVARILDSFTGFVLRSFHIWKKPLGMPISRLMPLPTVEHLLVLKKKGIRTSNTTWHPRDVIPAQEPYKKRSNIRESPSRRMVKSPVSTNRDGKRWIPAVLEAPSKPCLPSDERSRHPTQKPELLLRMLIRGYSNAHDLVLDPFAGSGSTLISAYKEHRRSIGVELSEEYYTEAKARISVRTNQLSLEGWEQRCT